MIRHALLTGVCVTLKVTYLVTAITGTILGVTGIGLWCIADLTERLYPLAPERSRPEPVVGTED